MKNTAYRIEFNKTGIDKVVHVSKNGLADLNQILANLFCDDFSAMDGELRITRTPEHDLKPLEFPSFELDGNSTPQEVDVALKSIIKFVTTDLKASISVVPNPDSYDGLCYEIHTGMKSNLKLFQSLGSGFITGINRYDPPVKIFCWEDFVSAINRCMFGRDYFYDGFGELLW